MSIFKQTVGQGQDLVILHGWGCNHWHMSPLVERLANHYRVTAIDLPGRGQSSWDDSIDTIHDIADTLLPHLPKNAIYIGWSFGGLVSMSIASRHPSRVARFIGIGTAPKFVAEDNWPGVPQPGFIESFADIEKDGFITFFTGIYANEFMECSEKPAEYHTLISSFQHSSDIDKNVDVLLKGIRICDKTDLRSEFKTIQCPIDLIFGTKDDVVPNDLHQRISMLNQKTELHTIDGAHHMPFWTHRDAFNKILDELLL